MDASPERLLIRRAALLVTVDPELGHGPLGTLEHADVLIDQGVIVGVGHDLEATGATVVDVSGRIVMPGFVDTHDHLWQSLIRGCRTDGNVLEWLNDCVFSVAGAGLSEDEVRAGVRLSTLGLVHTGVTTVLDWSHSFTPAFVRGNLAALAESGLRHVYGYYGNERPETLEDISRVAALVGPQGLVGLHVCSHPDITQVAALRGLAEVAAGLGARFGVHLLEAAAQREDRPVEALVKAGAMGPSLVADHAVHLDDDEIAALGEADAAVTHNPLSNMRLASGIAPVPKLREAGVRLGLGLDGGTNDVPDAFATMRAAVGLQRARSLDPQIYPGTADAIRLATMGGAEVLGLAETIGSLTPGKQADLIVLDPAWLGFAPRWDWPGQLVFSAQPQMVESVYVGGRALMRGGRLLGVDAAEVTAAATAASVTLQRRIGRTPA